MELRWFLRVINWCRSEPAASLSPIKMKKKMGKTLVFAKDGIETFASVSLYNREIITFSEIFFGQIDFTFFAEVKETGRFLVLNVDEIAAHCIILNVFYLLHVS